MLVNIRFVNLPSAQSSGKYGSIVTTEGLKIHVPVALLPGFRSGQTCVVATKDQTWGTTPVTVATSGPQEAPNGQGGQAGYQAPSQGGPSVRPNTGFQPRVVQGGGVPPGQNPNLGQDQGRHIFVTGCVGRALGSGKFTASEIRVLTQAANEAYDLIRPLPKPAPDHQPIDPPPGLEPGDPGPELQ